MSKFIKEYKDLEELEKMVQIEKNLLIEKGLSSHDPSTIIKAQEIFGNLKSKENPEAKSYFNDPMFLMQSMGYKDKPISLTYDTLRRMRRAPIVKAAIETRIEQIGAYADIPTDKYSTGFLIRKKGADKSFRPSRNDKREIVRITDFILNCGNENNSWTGDDFSSFLRKFADDSITLDQGTFEVIRSRKKEVVQYVATDGASYRIADHRIQDNSSKIINGYNTAYVQLYQSRPVAEFYPWELCFALRNPSTNIYSNGYGNSELEDLIHTVTAMLYADQYNRNIFTHSSIPKGIVMLKGSNGSIPQHQIEAFRSQWMASMLGAENAHKTPVLNGEGMEYIDLQKTNREMEYAKYQEYLIKVVCAIFKMDPSEIGFPMQGSSSGGGGLFEGSQEHKLSFSKDKGLKPILKFIQAKLNKWVVSQLNPEFELVFVGLDSDSPEKEQDMDIKAIQNYETFNEVRARRDLPPIEGGDIIGNPVFMQGKSMQAMGGEESNEAIDDMDKEEKNPFMQKSENPMVNDFCNFMNDLNK